MTSNAWTKIPIEAVPRVSLRPAEAAEALGVSERTLHDWAKLDGFPIIRMGGCRLIPVDQLRKWLAELLQAGQVSVSSNQGNSHLTTEERNHVTR